MIGRLEKTVIDCPDPRAPAAFSAELLGMRVTQGGVDIELPHSHGSLRLA